MLTVSAPTLNDADALLAFEIENRAYFEQWINARAADRAYQCLVWSGGALVGRVNLVGVTRQYYNKATPGYRIGAGFAGKGYASEAVRFAMDLAATELSLSRIEAIDSARGRLDSSASRRSPLTSGRRTGVSPRVDYPLCRAALQALQATRRACRAAASVPRSPSNE